MRICALPIGYLILAVSFGCGKGQVQANKPLELGIPPTENSPRSAQGGSASGDPAHEDGPGPIEAGSRVPATPAGGASGGPTARLSEGAVPGVSSRGAPISNRFREPVRPQADESSPLRYKYSDGTVTEIEGVCSITEGPITCWKPDGTPNPELDQLFRAAMEGREATAGAMLPTASLVVGYKNRVVVVKTTPAKGSQTAMWETVTSAGKAQTSGYIGLQLDYSVPTSDGANARREIRVAAEKPDAKTTTVRLRSADPDSQTQTVSLRVGSSFNMGGQKVTIESIEEVTPDQGSLRPGMIALKTWMAKLSGKFSPSIGLMATARDAAGNQIQAVDPDGNPTTMEAEQERVRQAMRRGARMTMPPQHGPMVFFSQSSDGKPALRIMANPAKIPSVTLNSFKYRHIDITGIPMDPKR